MIRSSLEFKILIFLKLLLNLNNKKQNEILEKKLDMLFSEEAIIKEASEKVIQTDKIISSFLLIFSMTSSPLVFFTYTSFISIFSVSAFFLLFGILFINLIQCLKLAVGLKRFTKYPL